MAVIGATNLTLADWAKRIDPEGQVPVIAELLEQSNEVLQDCVWKEGNLPTGDRVVVRTGLPEVYWRSLNAGIPNSKSQTAQVDEQCAILEARSEVDKDLAMLNGNTAAFRLSEDTAFLEAMNQKMAQAMFYGNPANDPKEFLGLAPRYSSTAAGNGQNVLKAGGSAAGLQTSVWLVCWGDNTIYCPFPKGSKAGLIHEDLGEQTVYNGDLRMQALSTRYQWKPGLVVKDWRYAVRIANVDVASIQNLTNDQLVTSTTSLVHKMVQAVYKLPNQAAGRCAFYMNRTVHSGLSRLAMEKSMNVMNIEQGVTQFGSAQSYLSFLGVPIRRCDALLNTEAVVL